MKIPTVPILAWTAMLGGGGLLSWYLRLGDAEKTKADQLAAELATELADKAMGSGQHPQAKTVIAATKQRFTG